MDSNFLNQYLEQNKYLARTLVIKSKYSPDSINNDIIAKYGVSAVNEDNLSSWKYYKNLAGEYHEFDTPMFVTSLDTLEEILFNKENLKLHSATKKAYQFGSRYYYALLKQYPEQESLIMGILYSVDIDKAVNSDPGTILAYPADLVEEQETTLIEELESFVKNFIKRWDVEPFHVSDEYYPIAQHAILYLNILPKLLNLRLKRCKTQEAHSFHIREYLASHGKLDRYIDFMTLKQKLWLYRNIQYIEKNAGKSETFDLLVEKLLTDRTIPLSELTVRQLAEFDANGYPLLHIRKKTINNATSIPEVDYVDVDTIIEKETPLVYGNPLFFENNTLKIKHSLATSDSSVKKTKDLESYMIDFNGAVPYPLERVLLAHWAMMTSKDLYNSVVIFRNPKTLEDKTLLAKDAFIYFYYITLKSMNIDVDTMPNFVNIRQAKTTKVSVDSLLSVVDSKYRKDLKPYADDIFSNFPSITRCYSVDSFFEQAHAIYNEGLRQWGVSGSLGDFYERGCYESMTFQLFEDAKIILPVQNIKNWLSEKNLPEYNFTNSQAEELITEIFRKATGLVIDNNKLLKNIQRAMIEILKQLSSYSIQIIREINENPIRPLNNDAVRTGNIQRAGGDFAKVKSSVRAINEGGYCKDDFDLTDDLQQDINAVDKRVSSEHQLPINLVSIANNSYRDNIRLSLNRIGITEYGKNTPIAVIGWDDYLNVPDSQKFLIKSIY